MGYGEYMKLNRNLSITIVNFNKYEMTQKCINSVVDNLKGINYEIIVFDNCSANDSVYNLTELNKLNNNVLIVESEKNLGFGKGNNSAVQISKYENILLLNPDVIVLDDSINKMLERILKDEKVGMIGCKLLNPDYSLQYSCRRFLCFNQFILARTPMKKFIKKENYKKINDTYLMKDYDHETEEIVDWIMGSCLMLRKSDFLKVGGFSEEYFMYFEDVDLAYKIKLENKKILYYPDAKMIHFHEQESTKNINKLSFVHFISMLRFYKKYIDCDNIIEYNN